MSCFVLMFLRKQINYGVLFCFGWVIAKVPGRNGDWGCTGIIFRVEDEGIKLRVWKKRGFRENL
jgi:hypothetical protein